MSEFLLTCGKHLYDWIILLRVKYWGVYTKPAMWEFMYVYVEGIDFVSILRFCLYFTIFRLDFGTVLTVLLFFVSIFITMATISSVAKTIIYIQNVVILIVQFIFLILLHA